jgi:CrcB protein
LNPGGSRRRARLSIDLRKNLDRMMWSPVLAISLGAAAGALMRWQLGVGLNSFFPSVPPGTLAANLIGGYIIGLAVAYLAQAPNLAPEWRLFIITGFCGGLTTFSTFSAEVVARLQEGQLMWAMGAIVIHVTGSLVMTLAGLATGRLLESL